MASGFSEQIKQSLNGDEYFSPRNVVDLIVPYVLARGYKKIWCPFDKEESEFVKAFRAAGCEVVFGHIETGEDFFSFAEPIGEVVVSNPPFSKKDAIFARLYQLQIPFALVANWNGLFDSKKRAAMFAKGGCELLVPRGRMKFFHRDKPLLNAPNFQSVYVCHEVLDKQIVFADYEF